MSNYKLKLQIKLLEVVMQCLIFTCFNIIVSFGALKYQDNELSRCFIISILVIFAYILRKHSHNFFIFFGAHIAMYACAVYYARSVEELFFYFIIISFLIAFSFHTKNQNTSLDQEKMPMITAFIMIVCYLIGMRIHSDVMMQSSLLLLVFFVIVQILYNNLVKVEQVFIDNKDSVNFPAEQLYHVNIIMIITSVITVFITMLAFYSGPYGNIFQIIGRFLRNIIGSLLKLMFSNKSPEEISTQPFETMEEDTDYKDYSSNSMDNSFAQIMNTLFMIFVLIILILIIIYILIRFFKFIRTVRKKRKMGADLIEFISPIEKRTKVKIIRKKMKEESEADLNLKLRKIYKLKVKKGIGKEIIKPNELPEDITLKAISKNKEEAKVVTDIYEKARYSNMKSSPEEIEKIKNIKNT